LEAQKTSDRSARLRRASVGLLLPLCWSAEGIGPIRADQPTASADQDLNTSQATSSIGGEDCTKSTLLTRSRLQELFSSVALGNRSALLAMPQVLPCLGVGESEDFYRSAGSFLERQPTSFLKIVAGSDILRTRLEYLVTMLPLSLVDDLPAQTAAIGKRIDALNTVHDAGLDILKHDALAVLLSEQRELKRIQADHK
jgi:hypothetical protein